MLVETFAEINGSWILSAMVGMQSYLCMTSPLANQGALVAVLVN